MAVVARGKRRSENKNNVIILTACCLTLFLKFLGFFEFVNLFLFNPFVMAHKFKKKFNFASVFGSDLHSSLVGIFFILTKKKLLLEYLALIFLKKCRLLIFLRLIFKCSVNFSVVKTTKWTTGLTRSECLAPRVWKKKFVNFRFVFTFEKSFLKVLKQNLKFLKFKIGFSKKIYFLFLAFHDLLNSSFLLVFGIFCENIFLHAILFNFQDFQREKSVLLVPLKI
jgi:hypothetical protein